MNGKLMRLLCTALLLSLTSGLARTLHLQAADDKPDSCHVHSPDGHCGQSHPADEAPSEKHHDPATCQICSFVLSAAAIVVQKPMVELAPSRPEPAPFDSRLPESDRQLPFDPRAPPDCIA